MNAGRGKNGRLLGGAVVLSLVAAAFIATGDQSSFAHTPHDRVVSVAASPAYATDHTLFSISDNRLLRSTDEGKHWAEMVRGLKGEALMRFAISPSDPNVIYVSSRNAGISRSDDQGLSWKATNALPTLRITREIAVSPTSADVLVAVTGLSEGVSRSLDGGATWIAAAGLEKVDSLTFVPGLAGRVVAGEQSGRIMVSDDNGATFKEAAKAAASAGITAVSAGTAASAAVVFAGSTKGEVLASTDAGTTWSKAGAGVDGQQVNSFAISGDYATDSTVWASTYEKGVYRSSDAGKTWTGHFTGLTTDPQANDLSLAQFLDLVVVRDSSGTQQLFLAGFDGIFQSSDAGVTWKAVETLGEYVTSIAVSPNYETDGTVVVNTYVKGVYISRDHGKTFVGSNGGLGEKLSAEGNELLPVRRMHNVVFSPNYAVDHTIFTATWTRFVRSTDGGKTWKLIVVSAPLPGTQNLRQFVIAVSPNFKQDQTIYLGTRQGTVYRSTKAGAPASWKSVAKVGSAVRSLVVSPDVAHDHTLFAGTEKGVFASKNDGTTWKAANPARSALMAISPNYATDGTVFAGSVGGLFISKDHGATWNQFVNAPLSAETKVDAIAVSPDFKNDGTVLVSSAGIGLYRSTDGAGTFSAVGASLLDRGHVIGDFENPTSEPLQFSPAFATDHTVYAYAQQSAVRSIDGGLTWEELVIPPASEFSGASMPPESPGSPTTSKSGSGRSTTKGDDGAPVALIAIGVLVLVAIAAALGYRKRRANTQRENVPAATAPRDDSP